jgi:hypothetical protein
VRHADVELRDDIMTGDTAIRVALVEGRAVPA